MRRTPRAWVLVTGLFVFAVLGPILSRLGAQAPKSLTSNLFSHVLKSAEVDAVFARIEDAADVYVKPNHGVAFRVSTNTNKQVPWKLHTEADEIWFVRRGSAKVSLAPFTLQVGVTPPGDIHVVGAGDVIYVSRNSAYRIEPSAGRLEYVAVRVFPSRSEAAATDPTETGRIPTVISKVEIDRFFSSATQSEPLGAGDTVALDRVIYNGKPGPWESHETADQIYFVRHGTAQASLDGFIVDAKLTAPGQIRGSGVIGASQFTIGPGDIVWIPRNTAHFIDPGSGKVGYFLVRLPTSEQYMPKSISQGEGAL